MRKRYEDRFASLVSMAGTLERYISDQIYEIPRINSVRARAKSPDRFMAKALKADDAGKTKYEDPFFQIQDQIGARITVYYLSDLPIIQDLVRKYYKHIEMLEKTPQSDSEFGYFGVHFILKIPDEIVPDGAEFETIPEFFELQIKTLFQHAWAEAHHDLGYKPIRDLTSEERRKVAFSAAQAWGADKIFQELVKDLGANDNSDLSDFAS